MSGDINIVFLGINRTGKRVYDWLCDRDEVFVHSLLTTEDQLRVVEDVRPDCVVSCGYNHLVPQRYLSIPSMGYINLHPAYLPYNRGVNSNVWSIADGTPAGVTVHYMDRHLDTGDIIAQRRVETDFSDTGKSLDSRLGDALVDLFRDVWPDIASGDVSTEEQDRHEGTYYRTSDLEELCRLDPDAEVRVKDFLDRLRALSYPPYRKAEIEVDGTTYRVSMDVERK
jgi:methionyl-tRNA formyltransferase